MVDNKTWLIENGGLHEVTEHVKRKIFEEEKIEEIIEILGAGRIPLKIGKRILCM